MTMVIIDGYRLDAAPSEDHAFESEVTSHPVEDGADITDHVRARPVTVSISGVVSDSPIGAVADQRVLGDVPSADAFTLLLEIRDAREPVTIQTNLRTFDNMVLTSLQVPQDASTGQSLRFRATFVQVELVRNERTVVEVSVPRVAKKDNRGNKPAPTIEAATVPEPTRQRGSILSDLRNGRRPTGFFGLEL